MTLQTDRKTDRWEFRKRYPVIGALWPRGTSST